jgi:hypothetical protein
MDVGFITGDRPVFPRTDLQIRKIRTNMCGQVARPGGGARGGGSRGRGGGGQGTGGGQVAGEGRG